MDSKEAKISIRMAGGFDLDFTKSLEEIEKDVVDNLIKELTKRKESVRLSMIKEDHKRKEHFRSIKFEQIIQQIEILF